MDLNEIHPYLFDSAQEGSSSLILGSFPVYECTDPDNDEKNLKREKNGSVRFFYGSGSNKFWHLYKTYIDDSINFPIQPEQIKKSLSQFDIAISDTILKCKRKNKSASDSQLSCKEYNSEGIVSLISSGVNRILCTSKGVLQELEKQILCSNTYPIAQVNHALSIVFQKEFISDIEGDEKLLIKPIVKVFDFNGACITAIAIPSPGSAQRKLKHFGFSGANWKDYSDRYFEKSFKWLIEK